jgi:hypothetical protein
MKRSVPIGLEIETIRTLDDIADDPDDDRGDSRAEVVRHAVGNMLDEGNGNSRVRG